MLEPHAAAELPLDEIRALLDAPLEAALRRGSDPITAPAVHACEPREDRSPRRRRRCWFRVVSGSPARAGGLLLSMEAVA